MAHKNTTMLDSDSIGACHMELALQWFLPQFPVVAHRLGFGCIVRRTFTGT